MSARVLQVAFSAALVWLLVVPLPAVDHHWMYRPCNLIQQACFIG